MFSQHVEKIEAQQEMYCMKIKEIFIHTFRRPSVLEILMKYFILQLFFCWLILHTELWESDARI